LNRAGARIEGAGTDTITIHGVSSLQGAEHTVMPDRIEAGTFLIAGALTHGNILVRGITGELVRALVQKMLEAGATITAEDGGLRVKGRGRPAAVNIETTPFPGFPTDMQAQFMVLMAVARGKSVIKENIFENRFMHVSELYRMGANIRVDGNSAVVQGVRKLDGARLMATDLRASASLILAGLCARGRTKISRVYHIDRGYERIERKLRMLGAKIRRVKE
jgi:UDP-N-acetylglucosamine 1-carboxyvinyltransferase